MNLKVKNITETKDKISILLNNGFEYEIPANTYDDAIEDDISDWINQIHNKTWMDIDNLYKVGAILSQFSKSIDWVKTYSIYHNYKLNSENQHSAEKIKKILISHKFKL